MTTRLLIVDDHEVVRIGLRSLLSQRAEWVICGEARNGAEAVEMAAELKPDVVILDLTMPVMNGFEAASRIRKIAPATKIVVFSMHDMPTTAREIGADAFVGKSSLSTELQPAIDRTLRGN